MYPSDLGCHCSTSVAAVMCLDDCREEVAYIHTVSAIDFISAGDQAEHCEETARPQLRLNSVLIEVHDYLFVFLFILCSKLLAAFVFKLNI